MLVQPVIPRFKLPRQVGHTSFPGSTGFLGILVIGQEEQRTGLNHLLDLVRVGNDGTLGENCVIENFGSVHCWLFWHWSTGGGWRKALVVLGFFGFSCDTGV